jgi:WD40 repeat protein
MLASGHFQDSIELPSTFDIVVLILGSRLGTPLPERTTVREYKGIDGRTPVTGTEWEYEEALAAARQSGVPDLLVYRGRRKSLVEILDDRDLADQDERQRIFEQFEKLEAFWSRHFKNREMFLGAYSEFESRAEFARLFEAHLRERIETRIVALQQPGDVASERLWLEAPFRGLEAYEFEHAPIFFGQDDAVGKAMLQLTANAKAGLPFLIVLGASGSGKSSMVKAGLIPKLFVPRRVAGVEFLRWVVFRPSDAREDNDLFGALARRLTTQVSDGEGLSELLGPAGTVAGLAAHLRGAAREPGYPFAMALGQLAVEAKRRGAMMEFEEPKLILLLDQLEEMFTNENIEAEERIQFVTLIMGLVQSGSVWVIAAMRKDFWHRADETPDLVRLSEAQGRLDLLPPSSAQFAQMIRKPAEAAGLSFEVDATTGLALNEMISEEVAREPGALPLLSYLLDQLYRTDAVETGGAVLTYQTYENLGRLKGAIATKAEAVLQGCVAEDQGALGSVLFVLVQMGAAEGNIARAVARRVPLASFPAGSPQRRLVNAFLDPNARLLVSDTDGSGNATVRIAHEALVTHWSRAREFVEANAEAIKIRNRIEERYALWRKLNEEKAGSKDPYRSPARSRPSLWRSARKPGLLTDIDLVDGNRLLTEHRADAEPHLIEFIETSELADRRIRTRSFRLLAAVTVVVTALAILAAGAGWLAKQKQTEAEYQRDQTFKAQLRLLTDSAADRLRANDSRMAENIILEVLSHRSVVAAESSEAVSVFQEARAADFAVALLSGHRGAVRSAAYSPDGTRIVTASDDQTARIWNATTGLELTVLVGTGAGMQSAAFSPDGTRVVTAMADGTAAIWDAESGKILGKLVGHGAAVNWAAFSPDGTRIVTASDDHTGRIWNATTFQQQAVLNGHTGAVQTALFSPDGTRIVTASVDQTARVWDVIGGVKKLTLVGHSEPVRSAAFSPDGRRIVTASQDKTVRIWDASNGTLLTLLNGHLGTVYSAAFSPDGAHVVTASSDRTARIWDTATATQIMVLSGHLAEVLTASYSPDGTRIGTASQDGTARIWFADPPGQRAVLTGHRYIVNFATFSFDGKRIATSSGDNTAWVWDTASAKEIGRLIGHTNSVDTVAFSADDTRLVTASYDRTARIWDAKTFASLIVLQGHSDLVTAAVFSPDGKRVATASFDKTARIWDTATSGVIATLSGHTDVVRSVAYSPDGQSIVTASDDKTARVWNAAGGTPVMVLSGHTDAVRFAAYSPDGSRIVTASNDKTARLWDARTGAQILVLTGHTDVLRSAAFSPDGRYVVTAAYDKTVRIWDAVSGVQLAVLPVHGDGVRSAFFSPKEPEIVAASLDTTATIWDPSLGPFDVQVAWLNAAVFDPPTPLEQTALGISSTRSGPVNAGQGSPCDELAAAFYDPDRRAQGVVQDDIAADEASRVCSDELVHMGETGRVLYQLGRALRAKKAYASAQQRFEQALAKGYRAAAIDLGDLLVQPSASRLDPERAISLYKTAVQSGLPIAAFRLGRLYETGVQSKTTGPPSLAPDASNAWLWYQQGRDAGEPNAVARFALRDEQATLSESDKPRRDASWLAAFVGYAAAARAATLDEWPDDAWKHWRFRRATLARLLAQDGMMQEVVASFAQPGAASPPH